MTETDIPDVESTDLTRQEMEEVAKEYDIDPEGLEDQELLERLGVGFGELDESQVGDRGAGTNGAQARQGRQRDGEDEDPSEQRLPGESVEGLTRNELRDQLRELGLPVTGSKAELQQRLDEAHAEQDDGEDADDDGDDDGSGDRDGDEQGQDRKPGLRAKLGQGLVRVGERLTDGASADAEDVDDEDDVDDGGASEDEDEEDDEERLRDRVADRLDAIADRLRGSGDDDGDDSDGDDDDDGGGSGGLAKLKLVGKTVKDRLTPG